MCADVCMDVCIDMCTDMCIDMCIGMRIDVCIDMRIHVRIHMCTDMRTATLSSWGTVRAGDVDLRIELVDGDGLPLLVVDPCYGLHSYGPI